MDNVYEGGCHCGAIRYEYVTGLAPAEWPMRSCQCSFCRAHGAVCTSDPQGRMRFFFDEPAQLNRYRFALRTADFLVCKRCGVYIGALMEGTEGRFAIACANALNAPPQHFPDVTPMTYDAETADDRVRRRAERWTPVI